MLSANVALTFKILYIQVLKWTTDQFRTGSSKVVSKNSKLSQNEPLRLSYVVYSNLHMLGRKAIMNGMALHGGILPYGGTFHMFSDYMRNGMRMSALMKQRVIYVLTHDSIGQGEDGPTHQPVEQTSTLRLIFLYDNSTNICHTYRQSIRG